MIITRFNDGYDLNFTESQRKELVLIFSFSIHKERENLTDMHFSNQEANV